MFAQFLLVALGSALGGAARYGVNLAFIGSSTRLPTLATLVVNAVGGLFIGLLAGLLPLNSERLGLLLMTGFCGGFTTFSAFSLEMNELASTGEWIGFGAMILLNLSLAIGGCRIGLLIVRG